MKMRTCFTDPHYWKNPALRRPRENIPNATIANTISAYDQHQKRYTVLDNHLELKTNGCVLDYERDLRQFVPERTWNMAIGGLHIELFIVIFYIRIDVLSELYYTSIFFAYTSIREVLMI